MGYNGICGPKGLLSDLSHFGHRQVMGFFTLVLNWGCFLEETTLFIIINKTIDKSPS